MEKLKLTDVIPKYSGENEEVDQWIDKVTVAAKLLKAEEQLANLIPLFLTGPAYATWKQVSDAGKNDAEVVLEALRKVFGKTKSTAWRELKELHYMPGDSVDVLAEQCQSLLKIVAGGKDVPQELVAVTLLDSVPTHIAEQVRVQCGEKMVKAEVVSVAKSLLCNSKADCYYNQSLPRRNIGKTSSQARFSGFCYGCGKQGHRKTECRAFCTICRTPGHSNQKCRSSLSGNEQVGPVLKQDQSVPTTTR